MFHSTLENTAPPHLNAMVIFLSNENKSLSLQFLHNERILKVTFFGKIVHFGILVYAGIQS